MTMRLLAFSFVALGFAVTALVPSVGAAQDFTDLPVTRDIAPLTGMTSPKADFVGIRMGEAYVDALSILKTAYPSGRITEDATAFSVGDNRGNRVAIKYPSVIRVRSEDAGVSEDLVLRFTSPLTGNRLYQIQRTIEYPRDKQADLQGIRNSLTQKYGEPTAVVRYDHQNHQQIYFTWEKRPIKRFPEMDGRQGSPQSSNRCLATPGQNGYGLRNDSYSFRNPGTRVGNPGLDACFGGAEFTIFYGSNPQTTRRFEMIAVDYERSMIDGRLLDETIMKTVSEKANSVKSSAPGPKL